MKTAEDRAKAFVNSHLLTRGMSKDNRRVMVETITKLLKEQDQITRHTVAENITTDENTRLDKEGWISKDRAHMIAMNTKAV